MATQQIFSFLQPSPDSSPSAGRQPKKQRATQPNTTAPPNTKTRATGDAATASVVPSLQNARLQKLSPRTPPSSETESDSAIEPGVTIDPTADRQTTLQRLRTATKCVAQTESVTKRALSTGSLQIDRLLPAGGLRTDGLIEWVAGSVGNSTQVLAMMAAANHMTGRYQQPSHHGKSSETDCEFTIASGPVVIIDPAGVFYPPAAIAIGIPEDRIVWCRPQHHADTVWSTDQALRCATVAAVISTIDERLDDRDARRFQLAAEQGKTLGLLLRPEAVRGKPSFAETRFYVEAIPCQRLDHTQQIANSQSAGSLTSAAESVMSRVRVTLDRSRGGTCGKHTDIAISDHGRVTSVSPLRDSLERRLRPQTTKPAARVNDSNVA